MDILLIQIFFLFLFMNGWFVYAVIKKRNDVADVAWGLGFLLLAFIGAVYNPTVKTLLIFLLVFIWGSRLSYHIGSRFLRSQEEDGRYARMREGWNKNYAINSWFRIFLLQSFLLLLVSSSIIVATRFDSDGFGYINIFGLLLWVFGFCFEVIGDDQLKDFISRKENSGKIMTKGLWKYTRHPNYFGEATLWWGIFIMTWGVEYFWIGLIGPITISILLRFVSGVPMAEMRYKNNKEYQEYAHKTPALIPNFFIK